MDYNAVWMFLKVTEAGSFTKAAREIGVPKSTLSKKVAELEAGLQVTLLRRTTRNLGLTEAGREFFDRCAGAFRDLATAETGTQRVLAGPVGLLRVTAPLEFGQGEMIEVFAKFLNKYPQVTLELILSGERLDFVRHKIDVAIRIGNLRDSSLVTRKLGTNRLHLVAGPQYLRRFPPLRSVEELQRHSVLIFSLAEEPHLLSLRSGNRKARVRVQGRYLSNNLASIKSMALAGLGIALMPMILCKAEIATGQLALVLPDWTAPETSVQFLYRKEVLTAPKIAAFLDFVQPAVRTMFATEG